MKTKKEMIEALDKSQEKVRMLAKQVENLTKGKEISFQHFDGDFVRFGAVSDTHIGSLYHDSQALDFAYRFFEKEGIGVVLHSGDLLEGEKMFRGQEYEVHDLGLDAQVARVVNEYPDNLYTRFITGNHDMSFWKRAGVDIGVIISNKRHDMEYMGADEADITFRNKKGFEVVVRLSHPGGGTAYALSYKGQKYIESLSGGQKPDVILQGHFHKSEFIPNYRNIAYYQAGTFQKQTPFMRSKNLAAMMGFWIIELELNSQGIIRNRSEFIPIYEK